MGEPDCSRPEKPVSIPPLMSVDKSGNQYRRRADIEAIICQMLTRTVEDWLTAARKTGTDRLPSEALVFLIRATRAGDRNAVGALVDVLCRRIVRIARRLARGFEPAVTKEILLEVQGQIIELLFATTPSRQSEFLEIAFTQAVERRTINLVEKVTNTPELVVVDDRREEGGEPEYVAESIPENRPGPEEVVLQLADQTKRSILIRRALAAVKDPRHVHAVILRYVRGWPITDKDPTKPSLEKHFGKSARQIQNWIASALEAMRKAIGDSQ